MEHTKGGILFSYERDFDDFPFITREEPPALDPEESAA